MSCWARTDIKPGWYLVPVDTSDRPTPWGKTRYFYHWTLVDGNGQPCEFPDSATAELFRLAGLEPPLHLVSQPFWARSHREAIERLISETQK
jgi:hypothetical protein